MPGQKVFYICYLNQRRKTFSAPTKSSKALRVEINRVGSVRAGCDIDSCPMRLTIFLARRDNFFYLANSSSCEHIGHTELPPDAIPLHVKDFDDQQGTFMNLMYENRVDNSTIRKIMKATNGSKKCHFLPKSIYNNAKKFEDVISLMKWTTSDMSDATKTLKKLEKCISPCFPCFP